MSASIAPLSTASPVSAEAFATIARLVKARAGIVLERDRQYMLEMRLAHLVKRDQLSGINALAQRLRTPAPEALVRDVVEALTTNESSFFRDGRPFAHAARLLPMLHASRPPGQRLRIWSAGCSTGQEAYSVAILVSELKLLGRPVEIIGTDLSREVIARAREGRFTRFEVQRGLGIQRLVKHFVQESAAFRIEPRLRAMCRFEVRNLLDDHSSIGRFDLIFCRNVLIYFDLPTKGLMLAALASRLAPDGVLYLGGAETGLGLTDRLVPVPGEQAAYRAASG